jgi:hypothetical protein
LNGAEIEFSALHLQKQCLWERCFTSKDELTQETKLWGTERNHQQVQINWRFSTAEARKKRSGVTQQNKCGHALASLSLERSTFLKVEYTPYKVFKTAIGDIFQIRSSAYDPQSQS